MHETAGPLVPSPAMFELLRLYRALGKKLRKSTLEVGVVHALEVELDTVLPDDVLVIMAMGNSDLGRATGLATSDILECAEDWGPRYDVPDTHVAIAWCHEDPFAEEGVQGDFEVLAVARGGDRSSPDILVLRLGESESTTLAAFAREKLAAHHREHGTRLWNEVLRDAAARPLVDLAFHPTLVGSLPAPVVLPERYVEHPKFGRGRVLEERPEKGETQLVVDFASCGKKRLLARFVKAG
jgi:hypothetical protein